MVPCSLSARAPCVPMYPLIIPVPCIPVALSPVSFQLHPGPNIKRPEKKKVPREEDKKKRKRAKKKRP